ncbi:MAG: NRDE family protein [Cyclobacteriaceae bacterium]|nr:NRDE family protein [Cyclobacteriaceae bacterium]
MCLILFALHSHPKYKLVLASNRDEFYNRPTQTAQPWADIPHIIAGRDLKAMGTWMGITTTGRIAMLTNYRDPAREKKNAPTRGKLVSDFLRSNLSAKDYLHQTAPSGDHYNGFNLIVGDSDHMYYWSNYGKNIELLDAGLFGLSNHLLNTPWPKVTKGKEKLKNWIEAENPDIESIFSELYDDLNAPDHLLPDTGIGEEHERLLSPMFIKSGTYGSRCSSIILIDHDDNAIFLERSYEVPTFIHHTVKWQFKIEKQ